MKNVTEPTEHCPTLSETVSAKSKLNVVLDSAESNTDKKIYVRCLENRRVQMGVVPDSAS